MRTYLCVRVLLGDQYFPTTKSMGTVDIRPSRNELPFEQKALLESLKNTSPRLESIEKKCRILTIVETNKVEEAHQESQLLFEEALDMYEPYSHFISKNQLSKVGYILDLESFIIIPLTDKFFRPQRNSSFSALVIDEEYPVIDLYQYAYSLARFGYTGVRAFVRAFNWIRKSQNELDVNIRFLFKWIALESLFKLQSSDDIIPYISLLLGFPLTKHERLIARPIIQALMLIPNYRTWRSWLVRKLQFMRSLRNNIVHNGFRTHETDKKTMIRFLKILTSAFSCAKDFYLELVRDGYVESSDIVDSIYTKFDLRMIDRAKFNITNSFVLSPYDTHFQ